MRSMPYSWPPNPYQTVPAETCRRLPHSMVRAASTTRRDIRQLVSVPRAHHKTIGQGCDSGSTARQFLAAQAASAQPWSRRRS